MKKPIFKTTVFVLTTLLILASIPFTAFAAAWDGTTVADSFESGSGTESDPYIIKTGEQLAYLANFVNDGGSTSGKYYALGANIDLGGQEAPQIGTDSKSFAGVFDGQGYTISNFKITKPSASGGTKAGLFAQAKNCEIKNLNIVGATVDVNAASVWVAIIAGHLEAGKMTACTIDQTSSIKGPSSVGAFAGRSINSAIEYCVNKAPVSACYGTSTILAGGIAGFLNSGGSIKYCANFGAVTATRPSGSTTNQVAAGGITGYQSGGEVSNCYNAGKITGTQELSHTSTGTGGIVGRFHADKCTVQNCYNTGDISGKDTDYTGTIIGYADKKDCVLKDCGALNHATYGLLGAKSTNTTENFTTVELSTLNNLTAVITNIISENTFSSVTFSYPTLVSYTPGTILLRNGVDVTDIASFEINGFTLPIKNSESDVTVQLLIPYTTASGTEYNNYVYFVKKVSDTYSVHYQNELQNLLGFVGVAIRLNSELGQGLRFKSSINKQIRDSSDYNVVEYGTLAKCADNTNSLLYITNASDSTKKIGKGLAYDATHNFEFAQVGNDIHFTSVLINISSENYKTNYQFRSYCIIEADGQEYIIYGRIIEKNIYDVAQNIYNDTEYFNSLTPEAKHYVLAILG